MKDAVLTFALACAAFALFYALLAPKPAAPQQQVTRPISTEKGPNGYFALDQWLRQSGVKVTSLRERYGSLDSDSKGAQRSLLLTTAPHRYPPRPSELPALHAWIARGNTLLVVAGLSDTPDWSMGEGVDPQFMSHMERLTGLTFTQARAEGTEAPAQSEEEGAEREDAEAIEEEPDARAAEESPDNPDAQPITPAYQESQDDVRQFVADQQQYAEPVRFTLEPNGAHPLFEGVRVVTAWSEYPTEKWFATVNSERLLLELARDPESDTPVLWLLRYGAGQILFCAYGSVFTNKLLGADDNAQLLANIVATSVGQGGRVLIDDAHQGLVSFYDPEAFFGDQRLHASLWWLLALWLVFVLGPRALRAKASPWSPIEVTDFVRATGGFLARVLKPAAAARQLFINFFNDLRRQTGEPLNGEPLWDWLDTQPAISRADFAQLQAQHALAQHGSRLDLARLQTLLTRTRAALR